MDVNVSDFDGLLIAPSITLRDARGMDDISLDVTRPQPARKPEAVPASLISNDNALDLVPSLAGFIAPTMQELDGCVERAQGSWRYEFYACYELPHRLDRLNEHIDAFAHLYNHHRPQGALGGRTPYEYFSLKSQETSPSQMC
jgi:hypothetical protein